MYKESDPGFAHGGWRSSQLTGIHEALMSTKHVDSSKLKSRQPIEWKEEKDFLVKTAAFEKRAKKVNRTLHDRLDQTTEQMGRTQTCITDVNTSV